MTLRGEKARTVSPFSRFLDFSLCFLAFLGFLDFPVPGAGWRPGGQGGLPYQEALSRRFALHTTTQPSGAHKPNQRLACASPGPSRPSGPHEPTPSFEIIGKSRKLTLHRTATRPPGDREIEKTKKSKKTQGKIKKTRKWCDCLSFLILRS